MFAWYKNEGQLYSECCTFGRRLEKDREHLRLNTSRMIFSQRNHPILSTSYKSEPQLRAVLVASSNKKDEKGLRGDSNSTT
jgi:hypothetical protein